MFARRREFTNGKLTFLPGYLFISKVAAKKHNVVPKIYPVSINKENSTMSIGKPTSLDITLDYEKEHIRIDKYLDDRIMTGYEEPAKMVSM